MAILFRSYGNSILLGLILGGCLLFNWGISFFIRSKERENMALRNISL
jgi:UDP-GlcNAc:undecaprenyl-phosphate GlcNAc-1-phosphate transferase